MTQLDYEGLNELATSIEADAEVASMSADMKHEAVCYQAAGAYRIAAELSALRPLLLKVSEKLDALVSKVGGNWDLG